MIAEMITAACNRYPDRTACRADGVAITYSELLREAWARAEQLKKKPGNYTVLQGRQSIDEIISVVACILAGRTYIPVSEALPKARTELIGRMLDNTEAMSDTAYVIFTSGSTGNPKGVPISRSNLTKFCEWIRTIYPLDSYDGICVLNQAPLSFDLSVADLYYSLTGGHTWVALSGGLWNSDISCTELFRAEKITFAVMTPSAMKLCLLEDDFSSGSLPNFRCVYFCGERLEKKTVARLWERFPELVIINAYGPTEATSAVCAVRITRKMLEAEGELPVGEVEGAFTSISIRNGEIVLSGATVFHGYLDSADNFRNQNEPVYLSENGQDTYYTGDCGRIVDGLLYCEGRIDSQIKYKGYRIELYDIENNLNRIPGVRESAVVAVKNDNGTVKSVRAWCVTENEAVDAAYIRNELGKLVPEYMIPRTIRLVLALPVNKNGKIDRKALENYD